MNPVLEFLAKFNLAVRQALMVPSYRDSKHMRPNGQRSTKRYYDQRQRKESNRTDKTRRKMAAKSRRVNQ